MNRENQTVWNTHYRREKSRLLIPDENAVRSIQHFLRSTGKDAGELKALDLGCGSCRNLHYLRDAGFTAWGQDYAIEAVAAEKDCIVAAAEKLPWRDETFDLVLFWGVIHYLSPETAAAAMKEIRRVLKTGGWLVATVRSDLDSHLRQVTQSGDLKGGGALFYSREQCLTLLGEFSRVRTGLLQRQPVGSDLVLAHHLVEAEK